MGLTSGQVFSIFIIVVMIGSILAAITYTDNGQSQGQQGQAPAPATGAPTTLTYTAKGVQAKVIQVFPVAVIIAKTGATETPGIEAALRRVPGVISVANSQFTAAGNEGANFRTEVRFSSAEKIPEASAGIKGINDFSSAEIYPQALVSVPKTIPFTNPDLGLTQDYSFPDQQLQAFISETTANGDEINVTVQAQFAGQAISNTVAFEEPEQLQTYFTNAKFRVASLQNDFFVRATSSLSEKAKLDAAKAAIDKIADSNTGIQVLQVSEATVIHFADASKVLQSDLNTFLSGFRGVRSFAMQLDQNNAVVQFDGNGDYAEFRDSLITGLDAFGFGVSSLQEPVVSLQGSVFPKSAKAGFLSDISKASSGIEGGIEVLQNATIDANSVFVPEANAEFSISAGSFSAYVRTTHSAGDEVDLALLIYGSPRLGVQDLQAQEAEEGPRLITQ